MPGGGRPATFYTVDGQDPLLHISVLPLCITPCSTLLFLLLYSLCRTYSTSFLLPCYLFPCSILQDITIYMHYSLPSGDSIYSCPSFFSLGQVLYYFILPEKVSTTFYLLERKPTCIISDPTGPSAQYYSLPLSLLPLCLLPTCIGQTPGTSYTHIHLRGSCVCVSIAGLLCCPYSGSFRQEEEEERGDICGTCQCHSSVFRFLRRGGFLCCAALKLHIPVITPMPTNTQSLPPYAYHSTTYIALPRDQCHYHTHWAPLPVPAPLPPATTPFQKLLKRGGKGRFCHPGTEEERREDSVAPMCVFQFWKN